MSNELKLAAKPHSFHEERRGQSFALSVPSFSFCLILCAESKNPAEAGFSEELKLTDKPGSVVDSHSSRPAIAHWLKQPTRVQYGPYLMNPYLALLRVEFTVPRTVTSRAVRSYRTLSPLPDPACAGHRRFALCCTGRGFPPQALPGTLPYGARTFLPSARLPPKEDDDEAATVWSASARSIEGLPPVVIPPSPSRPAMSRRCCATRDKYCPTPRERPLPAS